MISKIANFITTIAFVALAWYIYAIYPGTMNLMFAVIASLLVLVNYVMNYRKFLKTNEPADVEKIGDRVRIILTVLAFLGFLAFFGFSVTLGGSAAEDAYARMNYEHYEVGKYYLSSHGQFTAVSYATWIRMKVFEVVAIASFVFAFAWNFIHVAKTKGIKSTLQRKNP